MWAFRSPLSIFSVVRYSKVIKTSPIINQTTETATYWSKSLIYDSKTGCIRITPTESTVARMSIEITAAARYSAGCLSSLMRFSIAFPTPRSATRMSHATTVMTSVYTPNTSGPSSRARYRVVINASADPSESDMKTTTDVWPMFMTLVTDD